MVSLALLCDSALPMPLSQERSTIFRVLIMIGNRSRSMSKRGLSENPAIYSVPVAEAAGPSDAFRFDADPTELPFVNVHPEHLANGSSYFLTDVGDLSELSNTSTFSPQLNVTDKNLPVPLGYIIGMSGAGLAIILVLGTTPLFDFLFADFSYRISQVRYFATRTKKCNIP